MADLSMAGGSYTAPRIDSKEKNEQYHRDWAQFVIHHSISEDWRNSYTLMQECYKFLEEGSNGELLPHLQKAEDNTDLPAPWLTLNTIPTKVDLLVGELETRGYEIRVRALNKEAISRKLEEKERLRVKRRLQPLMQSVEEQTGLPTGESEYIPQSDQELREYMDLTFKDKSEIIMEAALKWVAKRQNWDEERKTLFIDVLASGRIFARNEIVRGIPRSKRVHPLNMVFDTSAKTDDLSDAVYFGELEYQPLASAAERYGLSDEELKRVYSSYQEYLGITAATEAIGNPSNSYNFGAIGGNRLRWFKTIDGELRVLVTRAVWRDYKIINHKNEINPRYGTEHFQEIKDEPRERDKNKIVTNKFEVWRQCTIIGGLIVREWGECPNQARDLSDLSTTEPPYKAWIPNFASGRGVSKVERLASIQLMKDMVMYNMNLAMSRVGAKGVTYDLAMIPDGWSPEKAMKYMRVFGVQFINSKDSMLMQGNTNTFKEFDMTISQTIEQYLKIMAFFDNEMDKISGVSPERQGEVQGASQGLGVTQSALFQSNLITAPYYLGFERFCSRVLNHQAKLIKIAWAGKEVFAPIIGDTGIDFLKEHIDLDLDEFGAWVESVPPIFRDRQNLENMLSIAVQSDPSFIDDALSIMMETDTRVAVRKFQRKRALRKIFETQQAQLAQEQQDALEERLAALESQSQDKQIMAGLQEQKMKNDSAELRSIMQGRTKLNETKLKLLGEYNKPQPTPTKTK